jgi:hypothetical protein
MKKIQNLSLEARNSILEIAAAHKGSVCVAYKDATGRAVRI